MSGTIARLILSIALLIFAVVVYIMVFAALERTLREERGFLVADVAAAVLLAAGWTMIWGQEVAWNPRRIGLTCAATAVSLVGAVIVGAVWNQIVRHNEGGMILGGMAWAALWIGGTALAWRETAAERAQRLHRLGLGAIACPQCGYNLTGLREARCPECGTQYTLDQLFAAAAEQRDPLKVG